MYRKKLTLARGGHNLMDQTNLNNLDRECMPIVFLIRPVVFEKDIF